VAAVTARSDDMLTAQWQATVDTKAERDATTWRLDITMLTAQHMALASARSFEAESSEPAS